MICRVQKCSEQAVAGIPDGAVCLEHQERWLSIRSEYERRFRLLNQWQAKALASRLPMKRGR